MVSTSVLVAVVIELVAVIGVLVIYAVGYTKVPPNMAMVLKKVRRYPDGTSRRMVVVGGGRFLIPGSGGCDFIDLSVHPVRLQMSGLKTTLGGNPAKATIDMLFLVKVSSEKEALQVAAENLVGKTEEEFMGIAREALEASLRRMFQELPYEEIEPDRDTLAGNIQRMICVPLREMGIDVRDARLFHIQVQ